MNQTSAKQSLKSTRSSCFVKIRIEGKPNEYQIGYTIGRSHKAKHWDVWNFSKQNVQTRKSEHLLIIT